MRVVVLTHVFPRAADDPLGAFLLHLARGFGERVQMLVVAPHAAGLKESATIGGIPVTRFRYAPDADETLAYTGVMHEIVGRGMGGKLSFARFLWNYFRAALASARAHEPDVIHAHWWLPGGFIGALVSILTRTPLIITTHGTDVEQLRRASWAKPLARFAFGRANVITCGSSYLRERLIEMNVARAEKIQVSPMPVSLVFEKAGGRRQEAAPLAFHILTVARLTKQKSIDTLIEALSIVRTHGIDARLKIAGDGDQRDVLQEKARALKLEPYVQFLGMRPQSELPRLYAECDVFVLASVREGMGLVLAEALLCGTPVIATNSGGVTDIVHDGETGLLFPERDVNTLAGALEKYTQNPAFAAQLAANGRAFVQAHYTSEHAANNFINIYEQVCKK